MDRAMANQTLSWGKETSRASVWYEVFGGEVAGVDSALCKPLSAPSLTLYLILTREGRPFAWQSRASVGLWLEGGKDQSRGVEQAALMVAGALAAAVEGAFFNGALVGAGMPRRAQGRGF